MNGHSKSTVIPSEQVAVYVQMARLAMQMGSVVRWLSYHGWSRLMACPRCTHDYFKHDADCNLEKVVAMLSDSALKKLEDVEG